jgi:hypothetical protein
MMILGEKFYYMHNHNEAKFDLSEIQALLVQPADIQIVDADTMEIVDTEDIYLVIVVIDDETFAATKPIYNEKQAHAIADILHKKLKRMYGGNGAFYRDED